MDEAAARDRAKRGVAAGKENAATKVDSRAPVKTNDVVARGGVVKGETEVRFWVRGSMG